MARPFASPGLERLRSTPWRRLTVLAILALLCAWTGVQAAREAWRAVIFDLADPWPAEAPVLWTPRSGHVERLEALAARVRATLGPEESIAVSPPRALEDRSTGGQGDYLYFWLAYLLPERDVRPATTADDVLASDAWLVWPDLLTPDRGGALERRFAELGPAEADRADARRFDVLLVSDGATLVRVRSPLEAREPR